MSKILIVEDEETIADLEKDYLELSGYHDDWCIFFFSDFLTDFKSVHTRKHEIQYEQAVFIFQGFFKSCLSVICNFHLKSAQFREIWDMESIGDIATVTVHIKKIREKVEVDTSNPQYIETIWGVGYRFKV